MKNYYLTWCKFREYSGRRIQGSLECEDLIESLSTKNNLTIIQTWHYGNAIKYIFRLNNKGDALENIDKAIDNLYKLRNDMIRAKSENQE